MKKIANFFIIPAFLGLFISCGIVSKTRQSNTVAIERTFFEDFKIMAYAGPPKEEVTLERYQEIADAGIEYLVPGNGTFNVEQNLKAMDLGMKAGIKIIPVDMRQMPFTLEEVVIDTSVIRSIVSDYKDHPAFAAYLLRDEPNGDRFPGLRKLTDIFIKEDPLNVPLINLLPSYGSPVQLGFDDYRSHVTAFIDIVKPKLLSYDYYPLREGYTMYDGWFNDLTIIREESRKVDISFFVFIQSEGIKKGLRVPNRAEILWQANTALAYGTRGIGWFCYWTLPPNHGFDEYEGEEVSLDESHYNAMIDANGNRTEIYDYVKEANLFLKKAGKGLLDWDNTNVARFDGGKLLEGISPVVSPKGKNANIVIGTYKMNDRTRVVISNSSCEEHAAFSLEVTPQWEIEGVFASIDAISAEESVTKWTLNPGGSVVIELK